MRMFAQKLQPPRRVRRPDARRTPSDSPSTPPPPRVPAADAVAARAERRRTHPTTIALPDAARWSARFGTDLSQTRLQLGSPVPGSLGAPAAARGNTIAVAPGDWNPGTPATERLLGHELAHVVQQTTPGAIVSPSVAEAQAATSAASPGDRLGARPEAWAAQEECADDRVSHVLVNRHINRALDEEGGDVYQAWLMIRGEREDNCCDVNRAAAEHYLFARYMVEDGFPALGMDLLIVGQAIVKALGLMPRTGDCPVTPESSEQVGWAAQGVEDGLAAADAWYNAPLELMIDAADAADAAGESIERESLDFLDRLEQSILNPDVWLYGE